MQPSRYLSPSTLVSIVAVVIASTGSATAATIITGHQIKNESVTSADIRDGSLMAREFRSSAREKLQGAVGPQGPVGAQGPAGRDGTTSQLEQAMNHKFEIVALRMDHLEARVHDLETQAAQTDERLAALEAAQPTP